MGGLLSAPKVNIEEIIKETKYTPPPFTDTTSKCSSMVFCISINSFKESNSIKIEILNIISSLMHNQNIGKNIERTLNYQQNCSFYSNSISTVISLNFPFGVDHDYIVSEMCSRVSPSYTILSSLYLKDKKFQAGRYAENLTFQYIIPISLLTDKFDKNSFDSILDEFKGSFQFSNFFSKSSNKNFQCTINYISMSSSFNINGLDLVYVKISVKDPFAYLIEKIINLFVLVCRNKIKKEEIKLYLENGMYNIEEAPSQPLILTDSSFKNLQKSLDDKFDFSFADCDLLKQRKLREIRSEIVQCYSSSLLEMWNSRIHSFGTLQLK